MADNRRVIGPIPPRDKHGKLLLKGIRDGEGNALARDPREHYLHEIGQEADEAAVKGLRLFRVDMHPEPIALVYARDRAHAEKVYRAEFGITRYGENDPKITEAAQG